MDSDAMKSLFLQVLERAKEKYSFRLENFCILGNHYHFIIQPMNGISLSRIMQWIMSVFAMAWNKLQGLTGHVWGERFFSRIVQDWRDFLAVSRYIDENPVRAGLAPSPVAWPFGGAWFRSGGRVRGNLLDDLGDDFGDFGDRARG